MYVDINGQTVNAQVENGTNVNAGRYTATAVIADTNYVINEGTETLEYVITGNGVTVSGVVTSFNDALDDVVVKLFAEGENEPTYSVTLNGNSEEYSFDVVKVVHTLWWFQRISRYT